MRSRSRRKREPASRGAHHHGVYARRPPQLAPAPVARRRQLEAGRGRSGRPVDPRCGRPGALRIARLAGALRRGAALACIALAWGGATLGACSLAHEVSWQTASPSRALGWIGLAVCGGLALGLWCTRRIAAVSPAPPSPDRPLRGTNAEASSPLAARGRRRVLSIGVALGVLGAGLAATLEPYRSFVAAHLVASGDVWEALLLGPSLIALAAVAGCATFLIGERVRPTLIRYPLAATWACALALLGLGPAPSRVATVGTRSSPGPAAEYARDLMLSGGLAGESLDAGAALCGRDPFAWSIDRRGPRLDTVFLRPGKPPGAPEALRGEWEAGFPRLLHRCRSALLPGGRLVVEDPGVWPAWWDWQRALPRAGAPWLLRVERHGDPSDAYEALIWAHDAEAWLLHRAHPSRYLVELRRCN